MRGVNKGLSLRGEARLFYGKMDTKNSRGGQAVAETETITASKQLADDLRDVANLGY